MNMLQIVTSFPRFLLIKISGRNLFTIAQNKFLTKLSEESNPARLTPMDLNPSSTFFFVQRYIFFSIIKNKFSINSTFRTKKINYEKLDRQKSTLINLDFCFSFFFFMQQFAPSVPLLWFNTKSRRVYAKHGWIAGYYVDCL